MPDKNKSRRAYLGGAGLRRRSGRLGHHGEGLTGELHTVETFSSRFPHRSPSSLRLGRWCGRCAWAWCRVLNGECTKEKKTRGEAVLEQNRAARAAMTSAHGPPSRRAQHPCQNTSQTIQRSETRLTYKHNSRQQGEIHSQPGETWIGLRHGHAYTPTRLQLTRFKKSWVRTMVPRAQPQQQHRVPCCKHLVPLL